MGADVDRRPGRRGIHRLAAVISRYEIHWVRLDPTEGRETQKTRPCVVISPNAMHPAGTAVVCPLTTRLHPKWATRLPILCDGRPAEVMLDQIRAVSTARFGNRIDVLGEEDAAALRALLITIYGTV